MTTTLEPSERAAWMAIDEDLREELLRKHGDINVSHEWWAFVYEREIERLAGIGIEVNRIDFTGFSCQGDGARFAGRVVDWSLLLPAMGLPEPAGKAYQLANGELHFASMASGNHYCHEEATAFESDLYGHNPYTRERDPMRWLAWQVATRRARLLPALESKLESFFKEQMKTIYRALEQEHDHLTSEEEVIRSILSNDLHLFG